MDKILLDTLRDIGLSDKEGLVLGILLERGPMLAAALAKLTKLNRTTVYWVLAELAEKGLVSSVNKKGMATRYQSIEPEALPSYVERRRDSLAKSKERLEAMAPKLRVAQGHKPFPKVQFFEGKEGVMQAYEDTLVNNKGKILYDITGVDAAYKNVDPAFVDYYLNKRRELGVRARVVMPKTEYGLHAASEDEKYLRTTHFLPPTVNFDSEISIYDDKVGIFSYAEENPVALIIEDRTIAHTLKTLFDFIEGASDKK